MAIQKGMHKIIHNSIRECREEVAMIQARIAAVITSSTDDDDRGNKSVLGCLKI